MCDKIELIMTQAFALNSGHSVTLLVNPLLIIVYLVVFSCGGGCKFNINYDIQT